MREKEALVSARDGLELKQLQCGHAVAQQLERVSLQVQSLGDHTHSHTHTGKPGRTEKSKGEKFEELSRER